MVHELKCWPEFFNAIGDGQKTFDVRKGNDRSYQVGDELFLREWDPRKKEYTGYATRRMVVYVMHGAPLLPDDVWVLGLKGSF